MILNDLKYKNKKLHTMDNTSNIHMGVNKTYEKNNSFSLKTTENFTKNKKMLTLNLNDNFFNKNKKKEILLQILLLY